MNILAPTVGDLVDRRMILTLKLQHADLPHWQQEATAIDRRLRQQRMKPPAAVEAELRSIHQAMWTLNEEIAALAAHPGTPRCSLGVQIWRLNQRRIELIAAINAAVGTPTLPEKAYGL